MSLSLFRSLLFQEDFHSQHTFDHVDAACLCYSGVRKESVLMVPLARHVNTCLNARFVLDWLTNARSLSCCTQAQYSACPVVHFESIRPEIAYHSLIFSPMSFVNDTIYVEYVVFKARSCFYLAFMSVVILPS